MTTEIIEHKDILGRSLSVGEYVAYPDSNVLRLGKIDKLNKKMISITTDRGWRGTINKYAKDTVKLDGPDLTMFLLTSS